MSNKIFNFIFNSRKSLDLYFSNFKSIESILKIHSVPGQWRRVRTIFKNHLDFISCKNYLCLWNLFSCGETTSANPTDTNVNDKSPNPRHFWLLYSNIGKYKKTKIALFTRRELSHSIRIRVFPKWNHHDKIQKTA